VRHRPPGERVLEVDDPTVVVGRPPLHPQIATEVHTHAVDVARHDLGGHEVGGQALADPAGIEVHPARQANRAHDAIDGDAGTTGRGSRVRWRGRGGVDRVEIAVVPLRDERVEHCGVERALRAAPTFDRTLHESKRVARHHDR